MDTRSRNIFHSTIRCITLVVLVVLMAACSGSDSATELESAATAQAATPEPTSEPTAAPEPTATEIPKPTATAAATATPTPEPHELAYDRLNEVLDQALSQDTATFEVISSTTIIRNSTTFVTRGASDQAAGSLSLDLELPDGAGGEINLGYLIVDDRVLFKPPAPNDPTFQPEAEWLEIGMEILAGGLGTAAADSDVVRDLFVRQPFTQIETLRSAAPESVTWNGDDFALELPSIIAIDLLGASIIDQLITAGLDLTALDGFSTVTGSIDELGNIQFFESDLQSLVDQPDNPLLSRFELYVSVEVSGLGEPVVIALPDESDIVQSEQPLPEPSDSGVTAGTCYTYDELYYLGIAVSCYEPHALEMISVQYLPDAEEPPTDEAIELAVLDGCHVEFAETFGRHYELSPYDIFFLGPTAESWSVGDREVWCFIGGEDAVLTQPLADMDPDRSEPFVSAIGMEAGMCIADKELYTYIFHEVQCDEPHFMEMFASTTFADGPFPGNDSLFDELDPFCDAAFETYTGLDADAEPEADEPDLFWYSYIPIDIVWETDYRRGLCFLTSFEVETQSFAVSG